MDLLQAGTGCYSRVAGELVLCSLSSAQYAYGYTGLILRQLGCNSLCLLVTNPRNIRYHTPLYWSVCKGKRRDFATVSFRE